MCPMETVVGFVPLVLVQESCRFLFAPFLLVRTPRSLFAFAQPSSPFQPGFVRLQLCPRLFSLNRAGQQNLVSGCCLMKKQSRRFGWSCSWSLSCSTKKSCFWSLSCSTKKGCCWGLSCSTKKSCCWGLSCSMKMTKSQSRCLGCSMKMTKSQSRCLSCSMTRETHLFQRLRRCYRKDCHVSMILLPARLQLRCQVQIR